MNIKSGEMPRTFVISTIVSVAQPATGNLSSNYAQELSDRIADHAPPPSPDHLIQPRDYSIRISFRPRSVIGACPIRGYQFE